MADEATKDMEKIGRVVAILPIGKLFDTLFAGAIVPAASGFGATLDRIGPEFSSPNQMEAICQSLKSADLVIADVSARNPHVMYLAGYALGTGRKVLFLTRHGEDFPFDQSKHPVIIYGSDPEFLKREMVAFLSGETGIAEKDTATESATAKFFSTFGDLLTKHQYRHRGQIQMENPTTFILVDQDMDLPLVQDIARRGRELGIRVKLM